MILPLSRCSLLLALPLKTHRSCLASRIAPSGRTYLSPEAWSLRESPVLADQERFERRDLLAASAQYLAEYVTPHEKRWHAVLHAINYPNTTVFPIVQTVASRLNSACGI